MFRKKLEEFLADFSRNAFFRSLGYGIAFSMIVTLIIGDIAKVFEISRNFPYIVVDKSELWVSVTFISFSLIFSFFGYLSDLSSRDDILSPLRQKLVGYWEVRVETWRIEGGDISRGTAVTHCTIGIEDIGRKLIMHFDMRDSDVWADEELNVTHITLSYQGEPRQLIYFHEFNLRLRHPLGTGDGQISEKKFPFLGVLNIRSTDDPINEMRGRWYDIDNTLYCIASKMETIQGFGELAEQVENGKVTFRGDVAFRRLPKPLGI